MPYYHTKPHSGYKVILFHFVSLTRPIKGNKISQFNNNKLLV